MVRTLLVLGLLLLQHMSAIASSFTADIQTKVYQAHDEGYIELYFKIDIHNPSYSDSLQMFTISIDMMKEGEKVLSDVFEVSPPSKKTKSFFGSQCYPLPNAQYTLTGNIQAHGSTDKPITFEREFVVDYNAQDICASEICFLNDYSEDTHGIDSKNGYLLEYSRTSSLTDLQPQLLFYQELYNTHHINSEDIVLHYKIMSMDSVAVMEMYERQQTSPIIAILNKIDLSSLVSGKYLFTLELMDYNKNVILSQTRAFKKLPPQFDNLIGNMGSDELRFHLKALGPITNQSGDELQQVIKSNNPDLQKKHLKTRWKIMAPHNTYAKFTQYESLAQYADKQFDSGFGYGFETDRGRTYIKYGPPNNIVAEDQDPVAPPYEIWTYYDFPTTNQTNIKFIFYAPDLTSGNYELLHSNAIGEVNNFRWLNILYERDLNNRGSVQFLEGTGVPSAFNRHAERFFRDD